MDTIYKLFIPFYGIGNWDSQWLDDVLEVTELLKAVVRIWTQTILFCLPNVEYETHDIAVKSIT